MNQMSAIVIETYEDPHAQSRKPGDVSHVTGNIPDMADDQLDIPRPCNMKDLLNHFMTSVIEGHLSLTITSHTDLVEIDSLTPCWGE